MKGISTNAEEAFDAAVDFSHGGEDRLEIQTRGEAEFIETGGIEAIEGSPDAANVGSGGEFTALAAAFKASGAALVCLCSSDKVYVDQAILAAKVIQAAGAKHIYLAGRPGDMEPALRAASVEDFISAGGDAVATLQDAYKRIG